MNDKGAHLSGIPAADECPACEGRGYPSATAQIIRNIDGAPTTAWSLATDASLATGLGV